ncbi:uncharacterized protein LOC113326328 [Papaver somniferum]|uniref:uncharacterized protein LOC113326328 n=1 Tax=Papaver somniferum TaxID=3469 RepID=UPI000E6FC00E|nr:uncharacterized protein LOC113326328 [Papaver somniferum]
MDKSWMQGKSRLHPAYKRGVREFIKIVVEDHLQDFGIHRNYTLWIHHGEDYETVSDDDDVDEEETQGYTTDGVSELLEDVCARANNNESSGTQNSCENIDMFDSLLKDACEPLYPNCMNFSKLEFVMRLMHIKIMNHMNKKSFQMILDLIKAALPEGETLPNTYYEAKKLLRNLGLGYTVIHACRYDCALFWKENENLEMCPKCNEPRYKVVEGKGKKIPQKVLRYFPLKPRLQRLFMSRMIAKDMKYWKKIQKAEKNVFRHPADSKIWQELDEKHN